MSSASQLEETLELFTVRPGRRAPCVAVLGPEGCGHHEFVTELRARTQHGDGAPPHRHVAVDMARIRIGELEHMYAQVLEQIADEVPCAGLRSRVRVQADRASQHLLDAFEALLALLDGWCIVHFENMDEVPRFFARAINRQLRAFREREQQAPHLSRLGFVVTGALSLFELKVEADSAFQQFHVVVLPEHGNGAPRAAVRRYLARRDIAAPGDAAVGALAELTGGEPLFLDAFLGELGIEALSRVSEIELRDIAERLARSHDNPVLRSISLDLFTDESLRDQVTELRTRGWISSTNPLVDIDRVQVLGLAIKNGSRLVPHFRVRNQIIARFLESESPHMDCADSRELYRVQHQLETAGELELALELLQHAWRAATRDDRATAAHIEFALQFASGSLYWPAPDAHGDEPERRRQRAVISVARGASERGRTFFSGSDRHLFIGTPLRGDGVRGVVVVSVTRDFGGRFSEHGLRHWIGFLRLVESSVLRIALAELGRHALRVGLNPTPGKDEFSAVERRAEAPGELILVPKLGALLIRAGQRTPYWGSITESDIQDINQRCSELGDKAEGKDAERTLSRISTQFGKALSGIKNLQAGLLSADRHPLIVTTDAQGLMLPLELLHDKTTRSAICLQVQVSRRILDKPRPEPVARGSFARLAGSLIARRNALRALIIASDPLGDLEHVGDEAEDVEGIIRAWCKAQEIPANVMIIGPNQCTEQEVNQTMSTIGHVDLIHVCGHGHDVADEGALLLRTRSGGPCIVSHNRLHLWSRKTTPWLVYMSTCHGGTVGDGRMTTSYTGVLDALTSAGTPYAVAFRSAISDIRAREFANSFYKHLLGGSGALSPSDAMLRARQDASAAGSLAWAFSLLIAQEQ